jgi:hypothetical protein
LEARRGLGTMVKVGWLNVVFVVVCRVVKVRDAQCGAIFWTRPNSTYDLRPIVRATREKVFTALLL